jgi:hypothetical protein
MLSLLLVKILIASCWWTLIAAEGQLAQAGNVSATETREAMTRLHRNIRQSLGVEEKMAPLSAAGDHKDDHKVDTDYPLGGGREFHPRSRRRSPDDYQQSSDKNIMGRPLRGLA